MGIGLQTAAAATADNQAVLSQARALIDQGAYARAYSLLEPHAAAMAGDSEYDYLLGLASLENGEANRAVFALERAVMTKPSFGGARVELARAYYTLGEYHQARSEFQAVKSMAPPPLLARVVDTYLEAIDERLSRRQRHTTAFVAMGFGDDNNANSATSLDQFGDLILADQSKAAASTEAHAELGMTSRRALTPRLSLNADARLRQQSFQDAAFANTTIATASFGLRRGPRGGTGGVQLAAHRVNVAGEYNNYGLYAVADQAVSLGARDQVGGFLRAGVLRFAEVYDHKNVNQLLAGTQYRHAGAPGTGLLTTATLMGGRDWPQQSDSSYGRRYGGVKLHQIAGSHRKTALFGEVGMMASEYDGQFLGQARNDLQWNFTLGTLMKPKKKWTVRSELGYRRSESAIALFDYERLSASITFRRQFM